MCGNPLFVDTNKQEFERLTASPLPKATLNGLAVVTGHARRGEQ